MLFTDADSLSYEIKSENVYEEFFKWKNLFDFSNYLKDSKLFDERNKKVIGKMKDEFGGVIVKEFVGLKSKMYSMKKKNDGKECNTAKEVSIATEFNKFKDVLFNKKIIRHKMNIIQSKKHKLGTSEIDKISLSCFDDKRYVLDAEIHTLAYFHKNSVTSCKEIQKDCNKKERIEISCDKKRIEKDCNKKRIEKDCEEIEKDCDKKKIKKDCKKTSCY